MKEQELINKFNSYTSLKYELYDLCSKYVDTHKICEKFKNEYGYNEFHDFMLLEDNMIALFFVDEYGEPCWTYHSIAIKDLLS